MKIIIKNVPKNEVLNGTEIGLPKSYFDTNLIDDPKGMSDINETGDELTGSKSYEISVTYKGNIYNYSIKAYKTKDYQKDRRLIIETTDPLYSDRKENDFLAISFKGDKITKGSQVEITIIPSKSSIATLLKEKYKSSGLTLNDIDDNNIIEKILSINRKLPLNQILFGPPGTGKTDSTIEKSLEILNKLSAETDEIKYREENRETFRALLNKKIFFVTMHPSYSYEDFVEGIKPKTSEKDELLFEPKPGIFKVVAVLAKTKFEDDGEVIDNEIDNRDLLRVFYFLSKFNLKDDKKASNYFGAKTYSETYKIIGEKFNINPNTINNHVDKFDFLASTERAGWKPRNGSNDKLDNSEMWPYNDIHTELKTKTFEQVKDIIKAIEKKNETKTKRIENNINYVIILDEINRANISKVFGELITLVEEDKRIGSDNALSVILASGESFAVPPNLYIIGTMNTADKSIALVDIALRRRFQFIPVYPQAEVIEKHGKKDQADKKSLMKSINKKLIEQNGKYYKGVDFQIGHAYFLKDNSLAEVINENIIPLLTEYFRNDLKKVKELMAEKEINRPLDETYFTDTGLLKYS
jgi:5-methylcytosine-specific restriction protein B